MTSILDQYEKATQKTQNMNVIPSVMTSSGYINMEPEDETPMFTKQLMKFTSSADITHMVVAGDLLVVAMANGNLFRMDLKQPEKSEEIYFAKYAPNTKLNHLFLDPLGNHLLLSFVPKMKTDGYPELLYLHRRTNKLKSIAKSKNYAVTEVGWNFENQSDITSGPILLGTALGNIIETEVGIENDKMFQSGIEQYWRQVFDLGKGKETPITGIEFRRIEKSNIYFILITTSVRLYLFKGPTNVNEKPLLQPIFASYLNVQEPVFHAMPSTLSHSKLQLYYHKNRGCFMFAWMTEPGILHAELDLSLQPNSNSVFTRSELIDYPFETINGVQKLPISFVNTNFHALIMFDDRVMAVSLLNHGLVQEDKYSESYGKPGHIIKDPASQTIWAATDKVILRYKITREERFVWKIYCDKREFELAKQYCNDNPAYLDNINVKQADLLFEMGEYEKSATIYAETLSSFETVCLKFLQRHEEDALKVYFYQRLEKLSESQDQTQISMLVIWICEIFLSQMSALRRTDKGDSDRYFQLKTDFELFLLGPVVKKCVRRVKRVIHELMSEHGDRENMITVNAIIEDYESVISHYIMNGNHTDALEIIHTQRKPVLFYKFVDVLLEKKPKETVNAMISMGPSLNPVTLLPSLLCCKGETAHMKEIIRYLEFMIENFKIPNCAIHNYLLTLYAKYQPESLMSYLVRQGRHLDAVKFDVNYALRLCTELNLTEACVKLSALLGLWQSAVEMALTTDVNLAKQIANEPLDDDVLRKKLWLTIAEHEIKRNEDVQVGMDFLNECDLLKIEDILPLFPGSVSFEKIRQHVYESFKGSKNQMEDLMQEMTEATRTLQVLRSDLAALRSRKNVVYASDVCTICKFKIMLRPFYVFPCGHKFHEDCLQTELQPNLDPEIRLRLSDLQRQKTSKTDPATRTRIRDELSSILSKECLYCGEYTIENIDKPFISDNEWDRVMKEWE